jgi:two-component system, OmpR family, sensor histidine kinase MprB
LSLRRRLTVAVASAVGLSLALAVIVAYVVTRDELRSQVDERLREQVSLVPAVEPSPGPVGPAPEFIPGAMEEGPGGPAPDGEPARFELPEIDDPDAGPPVAVRVEGPAGDVLIDRGELPDDVSEAGGATSLQDAEVDGEHVRVISSPLPDGGSITIARSLEGVDDALGDLRGVLFLVLVGGAALAALAARVIASRLLVPVGSLTDAAEHVGETEDLSRRIEVDGNDEVARLGHRFNSMLERLEASRAELDAAHAEQRQLIADASHELRTPVTSLRTNIEVIASGRLDRAEEQRALEAASAQAAELGALIGDLMDLARGEAADSSFDDVRLDEIAGEALERARRNAPAIEFREHLEPCVVHGSAERLGRAINNLLDNAVEHGGGAPVEVAVTSAGISVRDHGPGIDPAEAERVFDRFYRGRDARARAGSGLGLAIVKQVADAHGASVGARPAEGDGTIFDLRFVQAASR